jgi:hypothetical protein
VVVPQEPTGHLVLFAPKPFEEKDGGVVEGELSHGPGNPETEWREVWLAAVEAQMLQPPCCGCAVGPGEDDQSWLDASHHDLKDKLDVAGEVFQGVGRGPELKVHRDFEMPGLAGDEAVSPKAVFAGIDPGDVRLVTEGEVIHVNAGPGRGKKVKLEGQVNMDVPQEVRAPALGCVAFGSVDATHEVAGLWD